MTDDFGKQVTAAGPRCPVLRAWADETAGLRRELDSADLFGPWSEIAINHGDVTYRLRRTSNGKLLLTK